MTIQPGSPWREQVTRFGMRGVFNALCDSETVGAALDVLDHASNQPWLADLGRHCQEVAELSHTRPVEPPDEVLLPLLWQLYAASRVRDVLLFGHQPTPLDPDAKQEFDAALGRKEPLFGPVPVARTVDFFALIGCRPVSAAEFDPMLHEIVSCEPAADARVPIKITGQLWPGLLIGELVFTRAGLRVSAGAAYAVPGVADRSCLHWEYWRRHRDTVDGSFWWGHNSQWRTEIRRDYLTPQGRVYNLDAASDWQRTIRETISHIPESPGTVQLTGVEETEFIKNRCLLRHQYGGQLRTPDEIIDERR